MSIFFPPTSFLQDLKSKHKHSTKFKIYSLKKGSLKGLRSSNVPCNATLNFYFIFTDTFFIFMIAPTLTPKQTEYFNKKLEFADNSCNIKLPGLLEATTEFYHVLLKQKEKGPRNKKGEMMRFT